MTSRKGHLRRIFISNLVFVILSINLYPTGALSAPDAPVVAVTELASGDGVDSAETHRLTRKVRYRVVKEVRHCRIIGSKKMRALGRKHRGEMRECADDCAVEFGRLANADYVIGGQIDRSEQGFTATIELFSTTSSERLSLKERERPNLTELEEALVAAVPGLVEPLKRVVLQATDDEGPTEGPAEDPEAVIAAVSSDEQIPGDNETTATNGMWAEASQEPPLLNPVGDFIGLGVGLNAGYSFIITKASDLDRAYTPLYHLGLELSYQLFPFFQIALVGDFEHLRGEHFDSKEFVKTKCGALPNSTITSALGMYWKLGLRPTARLNLEIEHFEIALGVGVGIQYSSTTGAWTRIATDYIDDPATIEINDYIEAVQTAFYRFEQYFWGIYSVFELAALYRFSENRFGVGAVAMYSLPMIGVNGSRPKVEVVADTGHEPGAEYTLFWSYPDDYRNTFVRQLNSLRLLSVGLTADVHF